MTGQPPPLVQRFLDKLSKSRDLTISFAIHVILVAIFGGTIAFQIVKAPEPEIRTSENKFVLDREVVQKPREDNHLADVAKLCPTTTVSPETFSVIKGGDTTLPMATLDFGKLISQPGIAPIAVGQDLSKSLSAGDFDKLTPEAKKAIGGFIKDWRGSSNGTKDPTFNFTAYIGQYQGGNWNSTIRSEKGKIETGSLPNLLYLMSHWSKDRISTNYKNVQAIRLDSDELFTVKPPFIFLTGTRDFILTDKEVENLQNYLRLGGCIWGDSSVPGENSRFDIAFKREMRRVVGGDQDFAPLPTGHPLFTQGYFPEVKCVPSGLNSYQLPVTALKMYGEVAVIYTANDYGDMWQVGLDADGKIDLRRNENGRYVAMNENIYAQRDVYIRNLSPKALETSFKFGANVVMHLLTRWESKVGRAAAL